MLHHYSSTRPLSLRVSGKLSKEQCRLLEDYIDAHIEHKISLTELANLLHMSTAHFERLFSGTYTMPPYQFVIFKRVEKARLLLSYSQKGIAAIAHDCGFANQSHLNRHFKAVMGVTPGEFVRIIHDTRSLKSIEND